MAKGGFEDVAEAEDAEQGMEMFKLEKPDLVLLDLRLPGMDGLACLKELRKINPACKVIMVTIITRQESVEEAKASGALDYITKPITFDKLIPKVKKALGI